MYKRIMIPLDGSKLAECVLPHLEEVAKAFKPGKVVLVQAVEPISVPYGLKVSQFTTLEQVQAFETHRKAEAEEYLQEVQARLRKRGIEAKAKVIYGKAADALSDFANNNRMDLVILATRGRSGLGRLVLGGVAERLIRLVRVPVLVIPAQTARKKR